MFEGILLELPLAGFFLKKFRPNTWCDVNDLPTLDAELYRNLMRLRDYEGNAADLALTFTVADSTLGDHREVCSRCSNAKYPGYSPTRDAELYRNLMRLHDYEGNAADVALNVHSGLLHARPHRKVCVRKWTWGFIPGCSWHEASFPVFGNSLLFSRGAGVH